jgi:Beta propeller domain
MTAMVAACGGGTPEATAEQDLGATLQAAKPGDLVAQARSVLLKRSALRDKGQSTVLERGIAVAPTGPPAATSTLLASSATAHSSTFVQEPGIDEPDLLKTNGRQLYLMDFVSSNGLATSIQLRVEQPSPTGQAQRVQGLTLPTTMAGSASPGVPRGLLLADTAERLVALSEHSLQPTTGAPCLATGVACSTTVTSWVSGSSGSAVQLQLANIADDGQLSWGRRLDIEGRFIAARRIGNVVYLLTTHTPHLAIESLITPAASAERDAALAALRADELLPRLRTDGGDWQTLVNETDCLLQPQNTSSALQVTTLVALDLSTPTPALSARCVLGGTEALYMSAEHVYVATTRSPDVTTLSDGRVSYPQSFTTDIHRFSFSGLSLHYRGSGEVQGHLGWDPERMALRLSEHNGDLRVLSFTGSTGHDDQPRRHTVASPLDCPQARPGERRPQNTVHASQ